MVNLYYNFGVTGTFHALTFGEKILHKMAHDKRPLLSEFADKFGIKAHVSELIGSEYVVPTLQTIGNESELDFKRYPREFVLKPTHGSQAGIIVSERAPRSREKLLPIYHPWIRYFEIHPDDLETNQGFVTIMAKKWLNSSYRPETEYCYQAIPPQIIIEEYLDLKSTGVLNDFRFYTFHGKVKFFRAASGYATNLPTYRYDSDGVYLSIKEVHDNFDIDGLEIPTLPNSWILMKEFAERLSRGVDFVRADFYLVGEKIYFSELTNYPLAGSIKFLPDSFDKLVSSYWEKCDCCPPPSDLK